MNKTELERACEIQREIESITSELKTWKHSVHDDMICPLTFRMTGGDLQHTPPQALLDFKIACTAGMNKKLEELHMEFDLL